MSAKIHFLFITNVLLLFTQQNAYSQIAAPDSGKFLATAGVRQVEGAGGGGIVPWALITGYGTEDSYGANAYLTVLSTRDYRLKSYGVAVGLFDKLELSLGKQEFTGSKVPLDKLSLQQYIAGVKLRISGNLITDQDNWKPQFAIGAMVKHHQGVQGLDTLGVSNVKQLGAKSDTGVDYYASASKLFLAQSLLINGTLRMTKANQMGLLGFGGDKKDQYQIMPEASVAYLLNRKLVAGLEYRRKPNNLSIDDEKAYYDAFVAWFPNKTISLTLAYANLGDITIFNPKSQRGWYVSVQIGN